MISKKKRFRLIALGIVSCLILIGILWANFFSFQPPIPQSILQYSPKITKEKMVLESIGDSFTFAVTADTRISSVARIAVLADAQKRNPLFMVNLGDLLDLPQADLWEPYIEELKTHHDPDIPYFHTPGNHDVKKGLFGIDNSLYKSCFGRTYYVVDVDNWRFIFLDTSSTEIPKDQRRWLGRMLEECKSQGKRAVIFTHCPPRDTEKGITHAMSRRSTKALSNIVKGHDVAAVFCGHIHENKKYLWEGIPVYISAIDDKVYQTKPAIYSHVLVKGRELIVTPIHIEKTQ